MHSVMTAVLGLAMSATIAFAAWAQTPKAMSESEMKTAGGRQLTADELRRQLVGNTMYGLSLRTFGQIKPGEVIRIFHRDAKDRFTSMPKGSVQTQWWLEGNDYCAEQRAANAGHMCYRFWELGGTIYLCAKSTTDCWASVRFVPGNPDGL